MKINMNDIVRIKLTFHGQRVLMARDEAVKETFHLHSLKPVPTEIEMPLWEVMQVFGNDCGLGFQMPFETDIEVKD